MLLNYYSSPSEKSKDISSSINTNLKKSELPIADVTIHYADNATVNFGKNQSVFTETQKLNDSKIPIGCVCHIIHNAAKNGKRALRYDSELIIIKCYNEFSSSTKKTEELK
ncbi:unnamed protein product [Psylliodes chrysocephalus]|uniref:Uncharacterized protein n=1 Tax=Psylliodes chrysocephalus TaxID=3402493 RepID=A0A9P0GM05_9CUCU|nr:unnamed protein product [Psylliodes chrysocephala]